MVELASKAITLLAVPVNFSTVEGIANMVLLKNLCKSVMKLRIKNCSVLEQCGFDISTWASGVFHSLGFPGYYPDNSNCLYTIRRPSNYGILLDFLTSQTERNFDYVRVYDGADPAAPLIQKYAYCRIKPRDYFSL